MRINIHPIPFLVFGLCALASAQQWGAFYFTLSPRTAAYGQTVTFQCFEYGATTYGYETTWKKEATPISSRLTYTLRLTAKQGDFGLPAAGYSGPKVTFENLEPARYVIVFDAASDFKKDLGDSAWFDVGAHVVGVHRAEPPGPVVEESGVRRWRFSWKMRGLDGRVLRNP